MLECQRHLFDVPREIAYFNCASFSPFLRTVAEAGHGAVDRRVRTWDINSTELADGADRVRALFARLINAEADAIAVTPATSYGVAVAAANLDLAVGQNIVVLQDQFPSNYYIWVEKAARAGAEMRVVPRAENGDWMPGVLDAIGEDTAIAALPGCHWMDGSLLDLEAIGIRCREVGAAFVIDATQSAGAMPIDVKEVRPDFLFAAGYKWLMCPYALSFLYVAPERQAGRPLEANTFDHAGTDGGQTWQGGTLQYPSQWSPGARRFDMGERANFTLMPMAAAGLGQILEWGIGDINRTIGALTDTICDGAAQLGFAVPPPAARSGHLTGLRFPDGAPMGVQDRLEAKGIHISMRGDTVRVSPHLWVKQADIDRLLEALAEEMPSA